MGLAGLAPPGAGLRDGGWNCPWSGALGSLARGADGHCGASAPSASGAPLDRLLAGAVCGCGAFRAGAVVDRSALLRRSMAAWLDGALCAGVDGFRDGPFLGRGGDHIGTGALALAGAGRHPAAGRPHARPHLHRLSLGAVRPHPPWHAAGTAGCADRRLWPWRAGCGGGGPAAGGAAAGKRRPRWPCWPQPGSGAARGRLRPLWLGPGESCGWFSRMSRRP